MPASEKIIIDSAKSRGDALVQNPQSPAPEGVLEGLELMSVDYCGFDGVAHRGQIVMHKDVSEDVHQFFAMAFTERFPIAKVIPISDPKYGWNDERSCADNNTSGFNYRLLTGSAARLSKHALGLAFDINPVQNIYIRYKDLKEFFRFPPTSVYEIDAPGTLTPDSPLVLFMKERGWEWGGDWTPESGRVDYQHFQKEI